MERIVDPVALEMSNRLAADLATRGFTPDDDGSIARRLAEELRASIEAQRAAQLRYEQSRRGRLAARGLWPQDVDGWIWVALVVGAIIGAVGFAYAGYLEATAPVQVP